MVAYFSEYLLNCQVMILKMRVDGIQHANEFSYIVHNCCL